MSKLPFRITQLIWLVLCLIVWNILRLWTSLEWRPILLEFSVQPDITITSVSSMIEIILGVAIIWGIWQDKIWTSKLLLGASAGYTAWYWAERLIWQQPRPNWFFAVIVNLALILFVLFCSQSFTREAYERESQDPKTE